MNQPPATGRATDRFERPKDGVGWLRIVMPVLGPLVVVLIAIQVFEHINDPFGIGLAPAAEAPAGFELDAASESYWLSIATERRARLLWTTSIVCLVVVSLAAIVTSLWITIESVFGGVRRVVLACMATFVLAIVVAVWTVGVDISLRYTRSEILEPTIGQALKAIESGFSLDLFERSRQITNSLSLAATVAIAFAIMAATQLQPERAGRSDDFEDQARHLVVQAHRLHMLLYVGAAVLIAVVLSMAAWLLWPVALADTADLKARLMTVASGLGIFWGTSFTLMLAAAYLPSAIRLNRLIRRLREAPAEEGADETGSEARGATIQRLGLDQSVFAQVTRLVAILSPAITGALPLLNFAMVG